MNYNVFISDGTAEVKTTIR